MKTPWWFLHKTPLAFLLVPVSWIYYLIGRVVYLFRKIGAYKSTRPIICIGNILAGGVGKTPIVRAAAKYFDAPVVMRGYKKVQKQVMLVMKQPCWRAMVSRCMLATEKAI